MQLPHKRGDEFESTSESCGALAQMVRALPRQGRCTGSNPVDPADTSGSYGETEIMPAYEAGVGGSSPSGSTQARLAQWESIWSTPRGRRSDSFAEHGGY